MSRLGVSLSLGVRVRLGPLRWAAATYIVLQCIFLLQALTPAELQVEIFKFKSESLMFNIISTEFTYIVHTIHAMIAY